MTYNYKDELGSELSTVKLKKETNFITAQDILAEVRNFLSTYYERGLLDDSIFYPRIRTCLSKLGAKIYPVGQTVVPVKDFKAELPKDFHKLIAALGCFDQTVTNFNENPQLHDVPESKLEDFLISKPSYTCLDDCGENFYVIQRFETFSVTYTEYCELTVSKSSWPKCTAACYNKNCLGPNQIEIGDKHITTNFNVGWIFLEYLQNLESQDKDLLVPDYAPVRDWIVQACITTGLKYLYLSGEDVERKYKYMQQEELTFESNAKSFIGRNEFKELYDIRKLFFKRFDTKFSQIVYGTPYLRR